MFIRDNEQSTVGTWMCQQCCYVENTFIYGRFTFVSSSEGFQREAGGSLPLGAVATATIKNMIKHYTK